MVDDHATVTGAPLAVHTPAEAPLLRRLLAEFMGTLLLVAVGSGAATVFLLGPARRFDLLATENALSGAPEEQAVFQSIFSNSLGDLLGVALAFAFILAVLIYALGGVSGGHFNPAVSFALASVRRFSWKDVPLYWLVQCLGGIVGAVLIFGIYKEQASEIISAVQQIDPATGQPAGSSDVPTAILFGGTVVDQGIEFWQALLAEALIGFILMTAIMAVAIDPRAPKGWSGLVIGISLAAGIMLTGPATGGSANFARSLGPFVTAFLLPKEDPSIPWSDLYVYAAGPLIGALLAAFVYEAVTGMERVSPAPGPGAATPSTEALVDEVVEPAPGTVTTETTPAPRTPPPPTP